MKKNYIPGSMGFAEGILTGVARSAGKTIWMNVDTENARSIVERKKKNGRDVTHAELGLDGDWGENSDIIYDSDNGFCEYGAYHGSRWATPTLIIFYNDGPSEAYDCYTEEEVDA